MKIDCIMLVEPQEMDTYYPFSVLHPIWELRCGALRLFEKIQYKFPDARIIFSGRDKQVKSFLKRFELKDEGIQKENLLILNAAILPEEALWKELEKKYNESIHENMESKTTIFGDSLEPVAVYIPKEELISPTENDKEFLPRMLSNYNFILNKIEINNFKKINYIWDAIFYNGEAIKDDTELLKQKYKLIESSQYPGANFIEPNNIYASESSVIYPSVVIDASEGPVIIGENVKILPHSFLQGPLFIGDNSQIKAGAKIYEGCSFGEWCKIGGEVENTIVQSYSNKQHEGFLGHSFIGEWVNLGADTNNSDLKNTYGSISVNQNGEEVDTGRMFLGLICGDHTKTAINTQFNTGTITGICGIVVLEGFPPQFIPSYSWGGRKDSQLYKVNKAIEVAKIVMKRRNRDLIPEEEELLREEYDRALNKKLFDVKKL